MAESLQYFASLPGLRSTMGKFGTPRDGSRFLFDAMILSHHVRGGRRDVRTFNRTGRTRKVAHA